MPAFGPSRNRIRFGSGCAVDVGEEHHRRLAQLDHDLQRGGRQSLPARRLIGTLCQRQFSTKSWVATNVSVGEPGATPLIFW